MNLGELRQYVADYLADASDGKSDRVIQRVVNNALAAVYGAHTWSRFRAMAHVVLDQAVTRSSVGAELDAERITLGASEVFLQRWVDEGWLLTIEGEDHLLFQLRHLEHDRSALLAEGQRWIRATASDLDAAVKRSVYPLPDGCRTIMSIETAAGGICLVRLTPTGMDRLKYDCPTETGSPQYFTARQGQLEVWPPLGPTTTREVLVLHYERQPRVFTVSDADHEPIDWDERWDDVIRAAVDVELASKHQAQSRINPQSANALYRERLMTCKADDEGLIQESSQMVLGLGSTAFMAEEFLFRRSPQGPDE